MTIKQQLEMIAAKMENVQTISIEHASRLLSLLDHAPNDALQMLVDRKVKFMWMPARRRLQERGAI